jgi:hypothetical protein
MTEDIPATYIWDPHRYQHVNLLLQIIFAVEKGRPPPWSSGQSSRLQIRRPGFDYRHYQIFWKKKRRKQVWVWIGVHSAS